MARKPRSPKGEKKRRYTMSPKARAQRRVAARKHGLSASTPLRQVLPACNRRQCPLRDPSGDSAYPCGVKKAADEQGMVIESCPLPPVVNPDIKAAYLQAIAKGDPSAIAGIAATSLAAQTELAFSELQSLKKEGFSIERPILGDEGEIVGTVSTTNPRAFPVLKLLDQLGHTAGQQAITPKASGERQRDEGIGGFLEAAVAMRRKFAGGATP
jgi:hypothetical protein